MKVIHRTNLPARMPVNFTLIVLLLNDRFNTPGWLQGVNWTIVALLWICAIIAIVKEDDTDIFRSGK